MVKASRPLAEARREMKEGNKKLHEEHQVGRQIPGLVLRDDESAPKSKTRYTRQVAVVAADSEGELLAAKSC